MLDFLKKYEFFINIKKYNFFKLIEYYINNFYNLSWKLSKQILLIVIITIFFLRFNKNLRIYHLKIQLTNFWKNIRSLYQEI